MRQANFDDLNNLCREISTSFVHLETRDSYGTEVELPQLAKWKAGEHDDFAWLQWWFEMLREHRAAGRSCRRIRIVSEPLAPYQQWTRSHVQAFIDAGEDIRYLPRPELTSVMLPGSGDFYVFDNNTVLFLHYGGAGINTGFQISQEPDIVEACSAAFDEVWRRAIPADDFRSQ